MKVLITGASGFIGQFLARRLLSTPEHTLILTDVVDVPIPPGSKHPSKASAIKADLVTSPASVVSSDLDAAFLFHGIMSSGSEANFDLGMKVNIDATRAVLEALRHTCPGVRVIYASSLAVFGRPFPDKISENTLPTPESSYGAEKVVCEVLLNDYTRRGYVDGLTLRFPTICVRPGKPTAAASSFISGIIREPLAWQECVVPIKDRGWAHWVCSPKTLISNLVHALSLPGDALPRHRRVINAPGIYVDVQGMRDALAKVGGEEALKLGREEHDEETAKILYSWACSYDIRLPLKLGFKPDESFEQAVRDHVEFMKEQEQWGK